MAKKEEINFDPTIAALNSGIAVYKGFVEAEAAVKVLQGYQQNEKELLAAVDDAKAKLSQVNDAVALAEKALADATKERQTILVNTNNEAAQIKANAQTDADTIAEGIKEEQDAAAVILQDTNAQLDAAQAALAETLTSVEAAEKKLEDIRAQAKTI